jgi:glycosyltransferase involved in cell wall biosynthesis
MKLSVSIITYNHARFIAQAIESALNQRTNFDYEIVIGEDDSSDGTREIVAEYANKYPGKIKALFHSRKDVIYYRGKPTGRFNFIQTQRHCRGQYIAMLDGDDYWTCPDKLQQQVAYLDAHPEFAICAHDVVKLFEDGKEEQWINPRSSYDFVDLLTMKCYPPTCSVVFRNRLFQELPDWFTRVMVADFPLHLLNAQHGQIAHLPKVMAVYRQHAGGMWTGARLRGASVTDKQIAWNEGLVDLYRTVDKAFGRRYHRHIRRSIAQLHYDTALMQYNRHDLTATRKALFAAMTSAPFSRGTLEWPVVARLWIAALCPWGYRVFTRAKQLLPSNPSKQSV